MRDKTKSLFKPLGLLVLIVVIFQLWSLYRYLQWSYAVARLKIDMIACAEFLQKYRLQGAEYPIEFMDGLQHQGLRLSLLDGQSFDLEWIGDNGFRMKHRSKRRFGLFAVKETYIYIAWDSHGGKMVIEDNVVKP